jgi:PTS system D-glucosamine-specific IIC component
MLFLSLTPEEITLIILAVAIVPILALIVYAIVVALRRSSKVIYERAQEISTSDDTSQVELFREVYGGVDNIKKVYKERGRISVQVIDIEKVQVEKLKELGANGVLLVGDTVKCSFGDRAPYIYNILTFGQNQNE